MLAWSLGTGLAVCYGLTAFALVTGAIMIRLEERELEQRFGEAYREYQRRVPAVVPGIFFRRERSIVLSLIRLTGRQAWEA